MNEDLYESLVHLFQVDTAKAIAQCEEIICGSTFSSIVDFNQQMKRKNSCNSCQESWTKGGIVIHCLDCQRSKNSCICVPCYIEGNHLNHRAHITRTRIGNCDCGDPTAWKPSGFCPRHPGPEENPDLTNLDPALRSSLITIFSAAITSSAFIAAFDTPSFTRLIYWIHGFVKLCDAVRRCVTIAFKKHFDIADFLLMSSTKSIESVTALFELLGGLISDQCFHHSFTEAALRVYPEVVWISLKASSLYNDINRSPLRQIRTTEQFLFHAFSRPNIISTLSNGFPWYKIAIKTLNLLFKWISREWTLQFFDKLSYSNIFANIDTLISASMRDDDASREFVAQFAQILKSFEGIMPVSREFGDKVNDPAKAQLVSHSFNYLVQTIVYRIAKFHIYVPEVLSRLFEFLDQHLFSDQYDESTDSIELFRSTMSPGVNISFSLSLHILAFQMLLTKQNDMKNTLINLCETVFDVCIDDACTFWAVLPIRLFAAYYQSALGNFVRNSQAFLTSITSLMFKLNIKYRCAPLFSVIQGTIGLCDQKETYMAMIARIFGLFLFDEEEIVMRNLEFVLVHFIGCIIFDRACIFNDKRLMRKNLFMTKLMIKQISQRNLKDQWWGAFMHDQSFIQELSSYTTRISTDGGTVFKLSEDAQWHPMHPYIPSKTIRDSITSYITNNPKLLLPFPIFTPEPYGLDLKSLLVSRVLFAIEYQVLNNWAYNQGRSSKETIHLVLNLLITAAELYGNVVPEEYTGSIVAEDLEILIEKIPSNFLDFMKCEISFKNNLPAAAIQLIEIIGDIGIRALTRMQIGYVAPPLHDAVDNTAKREHAKKLKQKITEEYRKKQMIYGSMLDDTKDNDICSICRLWNEDEVVAYPVLAFRTFLPHFVRNKVNGISDPITETVFTFHVCQHVFHPRCCSTGYFNCPIDRCQRNAMMPKITKGFAPFVSSEMTTAINSFISSCFQNVDPMILFPMMVKSFAGEIIITEIRHRMRPDCIDRPTFPILISNLFLNMWHFLKTNKINVTATFTDYTEILVAHLFLHESPVENFPHIVKNLAKDMKPMDRYQFLRRCAIIQHFVLMHKFESYGNFIDWDQHLLFSSLCQRYKLNPQLDMDLPVYSFIDLPEKFLSLLLPPFKINILDLTTETAMCLLTGEIVRVNENGDRSIITWLDHLLHYCGGGTSAFLMLTGKQATSVFIGSYEFKAKYKAKEIYLDDYGDDDIGFERGEILTLSRDRFDRLNETLLSGDWSNLIQQL